MNPLSNEKGFTLVEILAAIVVFAFGMLALFRLQAATVVSNTTANEFTLAATFAQNRMEELMDTAYDSLADTNGDGTNMDADGDGIADDGNNFGLDKAGQGVADYCININAKTQTVTEPCPTTNPTPNDFRISQNIAVDQPLANTKTISVNVTWIDSKGKSHRYNLTSTKAVAY